MTPSTPVTNSGVATTLAVTLTNAPSGSCITVFTLAAAAMTGVSDSVNGAYTHRGTVSSSGRILDGWTVQNPALSSPVITGTCGTANDLVFIGASYTASAIFDQTAAHDSNFAGTAANANTSGSVTTTGADLVMAYFAVVSGGGVPSAGTSPNAYTTLFSNAGAVWEYFQQSSAGAINPTATTSVSSDVLGVTIALSPTASASTTGIMPAMLSRR